MRLFVALDLPETVRAALPVPAGAWRAVRTEDLHVTLAFLGEQPGPEPVIDALPTEFPPAGVLATSRTRLLPPRRPRVLAVELEDSSGDCAALQALVARRLASAGLFEPERRRWLPHVTVGRARGPVGRDAAPPATERVEFRPETVSLYRSHLGRGPARYEAVHRWVLTDA